MISKEQVINSMITDVIKKFGYNHENTVRFCKIAKGKTSFMIIRKVFQKLMQED